MKKTTFTIWTLVTMALGTMTVMMTSTTTTNNNHVDAYYGTGYNYVVSTLSNPVQTNNVNIKG